MRPAGAPLCSAVASSSSSPPVLAATAGRRRRQPRPRPVCLAAAAGTAPYDDDDALRPRRPSRADWPQLEAAERMAMEGGPAAWPPLPLPSTLPPAPPPPPALDRPTAEAMASALLHQSDALADRARELASLQADTLAAARALLAAAGVGEGELAARAAAMAARGVDDPRLLTRPPSPPDARSAGAFDARFHSTSTAATPTDLRVLPKRIILVRHAESEGNVEEAKYTIVPDPSIGITARGVEQAHAVGTTIRALCEGDGEPYKLHFFMSPYKRSRETADAIISCLDPATLGGIQEEVQLREQDFGNFQDVLSKTRDKEERLVSDPGKERERGGGGERTGLLSWLVCGPNLAQFFFFFFCSRVLASFSHALFSSTLFHTALRPLLVPLPQRRERGRRVRPHHPAAGPLGAGHQRGRLPARHVPRPRHARPRPAHLPDALHAVDGGRVPAGVEPPQL